MTENEMQEAEQLRQEAEEERVIAEAHRNDLRVFYLKFAAAIALPLAFIALVPSLVGIIIIENEIDNRVAEAREIRLRHCRGIEKLKLQEREDAIQSYNRRHQTFALLGLEVTPELEALALENKNRTLARNQSINCLEQERNAQ